MVDQEWFEKDYYKVLGVSDDADQKAITKAYRKLAREYHPDAKPGDTAAEDRFKEVSAAYDVIGDVDRRKKYDEMRSMTGGFGPFTGGGGGRAGGGTFDMNDIFGGAPSGAGSSRQPFTHGGATSYRVRRAGQGAGGRDDGGDAIPRPRRRARAGGQPANRPVFFFSVSS